MLICARAATKFRSLLLWGRKPPAWFRVSVTDTRNHAGGFLPPNKRERYFVAALAQINIYEIDARSSDFDYSFTGFRLRDRKINKLQGFRPARLLHLNGFHGLSRFRRVGNDSGVRASSGYAQRDNLASIHDSPARNCHHSCVSYFPLVRGRSRRPVWARSAGTLARDHNHSTYVQRLSYSFPHRCSRKWK